LKIINPIIRSPAKPEVGPDFAVRHGGFCISGNPGAPVTEIINESAD